MSQMSACSLSASNNFIQALFLESLEEVVRVTSTAHILQAAVCLSKKKQKATQIFIYVRVPVCGDRHLRELLFK